MLSPVWLPRGVLWLWIGSQTFGISSPSLKLAEMTCWMKSISKITQYLPSKSITTSVSYRAFSICQVLQGIRLNPKKGSGTLTTPRAAVFKMIFFWENTFKFGNIRPPAFHCTERSELGTGIYAPHLNTSLSHTPGQPQDTTSGLSLANSGLCWKVPSEHLLAPQRCSRGTLRSAQPAKFPSGLVLRNPCYPLGKGIFPIV